MKLTTTLFLLLYATTAMADITESVWAGSGFLDAAGNRGIVSVTRKTNPTTGITITLLTYSFCVQTTATTCLMGAGTIPNDAFTGRLTGYDRDARSLKLQIDTNTPGFANQLCPTPVVSPFNPSCDNGSPATGGIISLVFTKTKRYFEVSGTWDFRRDEGRVTVNTGDSTHQFSGAMVGSIIDTSVDTRSYPKDLGIEPILGFEAMPGNSR